MANRFATSSDYMFTTVNPLTFSAGTMACWININTLPGPAQSTFLSLNNNSLDSFLLVGAENGGAFRLYNRANSGAPATQASSNFTFVAGRWYYVAAAWSSVTDLRAFVGSLEDDVILDSSMVSPTSMALANAATHMHIASQLGTFAPHNGRAANVQFWGRQLSVDELNAQSKVYSPVNGRNLNRWLPCRPGAGKRLLDFSENANSFTAAGTLTDEDGPPIAWRRANTFYSLPEMGSFVGLVVSDLTQQQGIDQPVVAQHQNLVVDNLNQAMLLDVVAATQHQVLNVDELFQSPTIENASLIQHQLLVVDPVGQSQTVDSVFLAQHFILTVNRLDQLQNIDEPNVAQRQLLQPTQLDQSQSADNVTLLIAGLLPVNVLGQLQTLDESSLTQHQLLAVNALAQLQALDQTQVQPLASLLVDSLNQLQSFDSPNLIQAQQLSVDDLQQAQSLGGVLLTLPGALLPDELRQTQSVELTSLLQQQQISVSPLTQQQMIDLVNFGSAVIGLVQGELVLYVTDERQLLLAVSDERNLLIQ